MANLQGMAGQARRGKTLLRLIGWLVDRLFD